MSAPLWTTKLGYMELSTVSVFPCVEGTNTILKLTSEGVIGQQQFVIIIRITTLYIAPGKLISPLLYHYVSHRNNNC